jgi:hypothetical protein
MQFQMSYHVSKKYSSISEAFSKHFRRTYEAFLRKTLDTKMQFQAFSSISQTRKEH